MVPNRYEPVKIRDQAILLGTALGIRDCHAVLHSGCELVPVTGVSLWFDGHHAFGTPEEILGVLTDANSADELLEMYRAKGMLVAPR